MKLSVIVPTFNERENIYEHYRRTMKTWDEMDNPSGWSIEYLVIDNCSTDGTRELLKEMQEADSRILVYFNKVNYGAVLSPFAGLKLSTGDIAVLIAADLEEPPELIRDLVCRITGQEDLDAVVAVKDYKKTPMTPMLYMRRLYYGLISLGARNGVIEGYSGFGVYTRECIREFEEIDLADPSMRILVNQANINVGKMLYKIERRIYGSSSYSLLGYIVEAARTLSRHTRYPKFLAVGLGLLSAVTSLVVVPVLVISRVVFGQIVADGFTSIVSMQLLCTAFILFILALVVDRLDQLDLKKKRVKTRLVRK